MKKISPADEVGELEKALGTFSAETWPVRQQNGVLFAESARMEQQIQAIYGRASSLRAELEQNNEKLQRAYRQFQGQMSRRLPAMARAFARRDDAFYDLKDIVFQEDFITFYEQQKESFEEPRNARDPFMTANRQLVERYKQERELREQAEQTKEKRVIERLRKELEQPLSLAIVLQPTNVIEALNAQGRASKQKLWEDNFQEVYVPIFWERRQDGLMNNLNRALLEAFPIESDVLPREYGGIMQIELHQEYESLYQRLLKLRPKDFDKANIHLKVLSVKNLFGTETPPEKKTKRKKFLGR
ncbi:MAG: hypothetical protein Q8R53_01735 [Nanoarchaeota archaeon]|nr:hypothetical protein [Nanoarchaeota archaeon]